MKGPESAWVLQLHGKRAKEANHTHPNTGLAPTDNDSQAKYRTTSSRWFQGRGTVRGLRPSVSTSTGVENCGGPGLECCVEQPGSSLPSVPNMRKPVKGFAPSTPLGRHRNESVEPDRSREMPPPAAFVALGQRSQGSLGLHRLQSPRTAERRSKAADLSRDRVDSNL